jgi:ABC-type glycerol-3-phosphate transport system substrate-binding protein
MPLSTLYRPLVALGLAAAVISGCAAEASPANGSITTEPLAITALPVVAQAATPTPTVTPLPTPAGPIRLTIWWPEPLAPLDNGDAVDIISEQISAFQTAQGNVVIELRWKNEVDPGGILSTLRTASPVAPGALPDLTLLRREDLLAAALAGLIYPLEGRVSAAVMSDLYAPATHLGEVDGRLYGLAYALSVQHTAYRLDALEDDAELSWRYDDLLQSGLRFVFPAAQTDGINSLLAAQYLTAGGTPPSEGAMRIDPAALRAALQFYEDAVRQGVIDPAVLGYTSPADYRQELIEGTVDAGLVNTMVFLDMLAEGAPLGYGPIPTVSGALTGELDGWLWVLTTPNADRQALAVRFLNWMLNATRQGEYSRTVNMLPSQRTALQYWQDEAYAAFARELLTNATLPVLDSEGGAIARAVQNALVAVLSGQSSAAEATRSLMDQIDG